MNDNPALYETTPGNFAIKLRSFASKILYFNGLYKLPVAPYPTTVQVVVDHSFKNPQWIMDPVEAIETRVQNFRRIITEEADELNELHYSLDVPDVDFLVGMADLLGDIIVYCYSEAAKYGIPIDEVLMIIMDSNFSKLGADGKPIYDERGKVMKGPFYWKPEPKIRELLEERIKENTK